MRARLSRLNGSGAVAGSMHIDHAARPELL